MRWWLENRRDSEGWIVYACSWESGQDVSSRFGPQQTGGTIIQHVRPVDLQASLALSAEILARWATLLADDTMPTDVEHPTDAKIKLTEEAVWWQRVAADYREKTRSMWRNGWFRDYDSIAREWSTQQDAMHLAPVFCGVVDREQVEQLRTYLAQPPMHSSGWSPLSWPPVVMTLVEAAYVAGMPEDAAELAFRYIDGSYRSTDSRELDEYGGLPGVTREYRRAVKVGKWGEIAYVNAGIEGYGWGALSVLLIMRYVMGLREVEQGALTVAPVIPHALRRKGARSKIEPVQWGEYVLSVECMVQDADSFVARLSCLNGDSQTQQQWEWEGTWGEERRIILTRGIPT